MAYKMPIPEGAKYLRASAFYMLSHSSAHVVTSIAPVALIIHINALIG